VHLRSELCGGFHFLKGKFRMRVDFFVERIEFWVIGFNRRLDRRLETANIELRVRRRKNRCV
jgi:hypothetical protein